MTTMTSSTLEPRAGIASEPRPPFFPRGMSRVDLDAIERNVRALLAVAGPSTRLIAVVKANGYGHGAVPVAITALQAGASMLAVACVDEGIQLRQAGILAPVILLGATPAAEMERVAAHRLTPTICSRPAAEGLLAAVAGHAGRYPVHVKVDTGLHRFGISQPEAAAFIRWLHSQPRLLVEGLYTHFSSAEEADGRATSEEYARFEAVVTALEAEGIRPALHAANSAATMRYPNLRLDLVRPGFALYGLAASYNNGHGQLEQCPALSIHAHISRVHELAAGEAVGYGRAYVAPTARRVALVGIGYGDGLPRALSNRGSMLVRGQRAPILGRVSMDQTVIDVTDIEGACEGDLVTALGHQGQMAIDADEIAELADTIAYELVVGLAPRLPRAYSRRGRIVGVTDLLGSRQLDPSPEAAIFHWQPD